jgi:RNase P/RNase MRP subunit POP5
MKGEMQEQIPLLKKENLNYEIYAKKAFQELFKKELVEQAAITVVLSLHGERGMANLKFNVCQMKFSFLL